MRNFKKQICLLFSVVVLLAVLYGCNAKQQETGKGADVSTTNMSVSSSGYSQNSLTEKPVQTEATTKKKPSFFRKKEETTSATENTNDTTNSAQISKNETTAKTSDKTNVVTAEQTTPPVTTRVTITEQATTSSVVDLVAYRAEVIRLCNVEREKVGVAPLRNGSSALQQAADQRAKEIEAKFSHDRPNGDSVYSIFREYQISYRNAGENILMGADTPAKAVDMWMNSPGHKANILSEDFTQISVGIHQNYWVQLFIK